MSLINAVLNQDSLKVKKLLQSGTDVLEVDEEGNSAFILSIKNHFPLEIIELFIQKGVDAFEVNDQGVGAVDIAIEADRIDIVKYLHNLGLDLNLSRRVSEMTPLMVCACYNRVDIAKYLILNDVQTDKKDVNGLSAFDYARKLGQQAMSEFLQRL